MGPAITRVAAVQSWPEFRNDATRSPSATALGSASSKTTTGALPPSSRCTRLSVSAAVRAIHLPVPTLPVKDTMLISGCWTMCAPTPGPSPVTTFRTPFGRTSTSSSAKRSVETGVSSDGFNTTTLPAASAGAIFQIAIING